MDIIVGYGLAVCKTLDMGYGWRPWTLSMTSQDTLYFHIFLGGRDISYMIVIAVCYPPLQLRTYVCMHACIMASLPLCDNKYNRGNTTKLLTIRDLSCYSGGSESNGSLVINNIT